ncbi:hypothetical protein LIER_14868 [Lithospermum erythrorhizon]|uniref:Uncharacterized protein n=1 Tax=Lithospermum erythrorhizon TaxID=34254 RepID=A0AAV3Q3W2_LITER
MPPNSYKDVQKFTECSEAFEELKRCLGSPQFLSQPGVGERFQLYLAISDVEVLTDQPLKRVLSSPALLGWLTTWVIQLSEFEISYVPRTRIRARVLEDFVTECTARSPPIIQGPRADDPSLPKPDCALYVDGARNRAEVLVMGGDNGAVEKSQSFKWIIFEHIPWAENENADRLSRLATTYYIELPEGVYVEVCDQPAYKEEVIKNITGSNTTDWRAPIIEYIANGKLPSDNLEAKKVQNRSFKYQIYQGELYRKSWDGPLLTYVASEDVPKVLAEVHEG